MDQETSKSRGFPRLSVGCQADPVHAIKEPNQSHGRFSNRRRLDGSLLRSAATRRRLLAVQLSTGSSSSPSVGALHNFLSTERWQCLGFDEQDEPFGLHVVVSSLCVCHQPDNSRTSARVAWAEGAFPVKLTQPLGRLLPTTKKIKKNKYVRILCIPPSVFGCANPIQCSVYAHLTPSS